MQYGQIAGLDKPVSRIIQGTVMIAMARKDYSFELLDGIFAAGCTTFDTAHGYGQGDCERTLGRWIQERGLRDSVVIITKGAHHNADRRRVTPYDITADLHDSLARLQVDSVDLYLLHRDDPTQPVGPIVEVLNEHHAAGKIRAFGGSNWSKERIEAAHEYAAKHNLVPFAASSPNFSLAEQHEPPWENCISVGGPSGAAVRQWYTQNQLPVLAWSSLAGGFFSGRFRRDNLHTLTDYFDKTSIAAYCYEDNFQRLDRAESLAQQKGLTLPQIALAYVLNSPMNVFALVGCRTAAEFRDNAAVLEVRLTPEEIAWLENGD